MMATELVLGTEAESRLSNRAIARITVPLAFSSFGEFALESIAYIWVVTTFGSSTPLSTAMVGGLIIASTIPRLLVAPYAGVFADTRGARRSLVLADLSRLICVTSYVGIALIFRSSSVEAIALLVLCLGVAATSQLLPPARAVAVRTGVAVPYRTRASSITLGTMTLSGLASGGLAPLMFVAWGLPVVLGVIGGSFLAGALLSWALLSGSLGDPVPNQAPVGVHRGLLLALRAAFEVPELRMIVSGVGVYGLALGVTNAALPVFLMGPVALNAQQYGLVTAGFAIGSFLGIIAAPPLVRKVGSPRTYTGALVCLGGGYMAFSWSGQFLVAFALMTACGAAFATFSVTQGPIIQTASPEGMTGRVTAVMGPILAMTSIVGAAIATLTFALVKSLGGDMFASYRWTITCAGVVVIVGGMLIANSRRRQEIGKGLSE